MFVCLFVWLVGFFCFFFLCFLFISLCSNSLFLSLNLSHPLFFFSLVSFSSPLPTLKQLWRGRGGGQFLLLILMCQFFFLICFHCPMKLSNFKWRSAHKMTRRHTSLLREKKGAGTSSPNKEHYFPLYRPQQNYSYHLLSWPETKQFSSTLLLVNLTYVFWSISFLYIFFKKEFSFFSFFLFQ